MDVSVTTWAVTLTVLVAVYVVDFAVAARRPHVVGMREAAVWVAVYAVLAALFGLWVSTAYSWTYAGQFFAGWITEYSLSVDNLFVFVLIMASFSVPRLHQQKVLQLGILGALVLRFAFIMVGAAAINRFSSVFYLFGAFLLYTAFRLATGGEIDPGDPADSRVTLVSLTRKGLALKPSFQIIAQKLRGKSYRGMSDGERETLFDLLDKINANL